MNKFILIQVLTGTHRSLLFLPLPSVQIIVLIMFFTNSWRFQMQSHRRINSVKMFFPSRSKLALSTHMFFITRHVLLWRHLSKNPSVPGVPQIFALTMLRETAFVELSISGLVILIAHYIFNKQAKQIQECDKNECECRRCQQICNSLCVSNWHLMSHIPPLQFFVLTSAFF